MTRYITLLSSLGMVSACAQTAFEGGEASVCLGSDAATAIPVTAKATWEVTGMVTAVRDFDPTDSTTSNCGSNISTAIDVLDMTGTTWTLGYGILDSQGKQSLPEIDLAIDETVNVIVRQSESGLARGFVIRDGSGIIAAVDEGTGGGALTKEDLDGLTISHGYAVGNSTDECGEMEGTQIDFRGSTSAKTSPFGTTTVEIDGMPLEAIAIDSYYWTDSECDDAVGQLTWAIFR